MGRFVFALPECFTLDSLCSKGGSADYGFCLTQGRRTEIAMEDFHSDVKHNSDVSVYAVYDGHGGDKCARAMASALPSSVIAALAQEPSNASSALVEGFKQADEQWLSANENDLSGTTATVMVHCKESFSIGHVGDSRAVLCRAGKAVPLTRDHRASDEEEGARISQLGGWVSVPSGPDDAARVNGVLEISRGLGDREFKELIRPDADVYTHVTQPEDEFVIIASDGLWDVVDNQTAVSAVKRLPESTTAAQMAEKLALLAWKSRSADHIGVVVVNLQQTMTPPLDTPLPVAPPVVNETPSGTQTPPLALESVSLLPSTPRNESPPSSPQPTLLPPAASFHTLVAPLSPSMYCPPEAEEVVFMVDKNCSPDHTAPGHSCSNSLLSSPSPTASDKTRSAPAHHRRGSHSVSMSQKWRSKPPVQTNVAAICAAARQVKRRVCRLLRPRCCGGEDRPSKAQRHVPCFCSPRTASTSEGSLVVVAHAHDKDTLTPLKD